MLQKILLAILVSILSACGHAPSPPNVELGVIDYPSNEVIVNMTGNTDLNQMKSLPSYDHVVDQIVAKGNRVPLASYDRAIAFKSNYWKMVQDYIDSLERYIKNHCSGSID